MVTGEMWYVHGPQPFIQKICKWTVTTNCCSYFIASGLLLVTRQYTILVNKCAAYTQNTHMRGGNDPPCPLCGMPGQGATRGPFAAARRRTLTQQFHNGVCKALTKLAASPPHTIAESPRGVWERAVDRISPRTATSLRQLVLTQLLQCRGDVLPPDVLAHVILALNDASAEQAALLHINDETRTALMHHFEARMEAVAVHLLSATSGARCVLQGVFYACARYFPFRRSRWRMYWVRRRSRSASSRLSASAWRSTPLTSSCC